MHTTLSKEKKISVNPSTAPTPPDAPAPVDGRAIITVRDLAKHYGPFQAVGGVTFDIREGEIFGLLGPNGAGKTTLISMLATLLAPTSGSAAINGFDLVRDSKRVKQSIGLVPQEIALYLQLSTRDNLHFFGRMYGLKGDLLQKRINEALNIIALGPWANVPVGGYSGGMTRRANLAIGLLHKPRVLFLDEPTVGVDPQSRNHIFESIRKLNREDGVTILYTTHYMEEAQSLCDRVAIMDYGRLIALDTPRNLINQIGTGIIHLTLEKDPEPLIGRLSSLPAVERVDSSEETLRIHTKDAQQALLPIMDIVNSLGMHATHLEILEPNLESVFLSLTGRSLRD
ncbi:MAG TPA: ATP-binding cassette domain-containing protein [Dehalococcoidia bacterium]|jgi:ABC-2 type transport system ATP-binding protein|nr:ATP-binding cassette domain-containing protein [Dehalococcoidia bacterium]